MLLKPFSNRQNVSLKRKVLLNTGKAKEPYFKRELRLAKATLQYEKKASTYNKVIRSMIILGAVGFIAGCLLGNYFIAPVLAIGLALIPIWKVNLSRHKYDIFVADELESGLSILTTAYIRKNNLILAIRENLSNLNEPLHDVMQLFLSLCDNATPSVTHAINTVRPLISNDIWDEWCRELIKCQSNSTLRPNLIRIVHKLSDIKMVQSDLDVQMSKVIKEFICLIILVGFCPFLVYIVNPTWFSYYFTTLFGQITLSLAAVAAIISAAKLVTIIKPVRYRR